MDVEFGKTAKDYATYRKGFPDSFFDALIAKKIVEPQDSLLDLGTGTGTVARGFAARGCRAIGLDPAVELLEQGRVLAGDAGLAVEFVEGAAERTGFDAERFDAVTAGQCWHWFDGPAAAAEVWRLLRPGGRVAIAHYDWLPLGRNVVSLTEELILKYNPQWTLGGKTGIYPRWPRDLGEAGFIDIETFSYDELAPYTPAAWRGRIRASAGVAASLDPAMVEWFDRELAQLLQANFPTDMLQVPHRIFVVHGRKPR
jgi:SAM-dependent methyltransferase